MPHLIFYLQGWNMAQKQARRPGSWNSSQIFLILGVVTFVVTTLVASLLFIRTKTTFMWFHDASRTLSTLDELLIQMTTLESEVRGFALPGDESLVASYLRDSQSVTNQLTTLKTLIQDSSSQAENAKYLDVLVGKQQAALYKLIRAARQDEGRQMAQLQGNHLMTAINAVIKLMRNSEDNAIDNHYADLQHKIFEFLVFLIAGSGASTTLLLFASRSTVRELTLRKRTEKNLTASQAVLSQKEMLLQSVFESVVDGIVVSDQDGVIVSWNRSAEDIFGYRASEAIGRNLTLIVGPEHQSRHQDYIKKYLETGHGDLMGKSREVNAKDREGNTIPIELTLSAVKQAGQPHFVGVVRDLRIAKEAEAERIARQTAEASNAAKTQFISAISHELRTPLGIVLGYAELLASMKLSEEQRAEYAAIILRNGKNLLALLNDILDLSKVESGLMTIEREPIAFVPFISELIEQGRIVTDPKGLALSWRAVTNLPASIDSDPLRLRQVLLNLLTNAAKFTVKGAIEIEVALLDNPADPDSWLLKFSVTDSGCGVEKSKQQLIFEPFTQADSSVARRFGGTGLGLGLARRIANQLGGNVVLERSEIGKGSTFAATVSIAKRASAHLVSPELTPMQHSTTIGPPSLIC